MNDEQTNGKLRFSLTLRDIATVGSTILTLALFIATVALHVSSDEIHQSTIDKQRNHKEWTEPLDTRARMNSARTADNKIQVELLNQKYRQIAEDIREIRRLLEVDRKK